MSESDGPPRSLFIAAVAVAVAAIVAVLAVAATRQPARRPVPVASVPAPRSGDPACAALLNALPEELGDYRRAEPAEPAPQGAAAWEAQPGTEPVILRCGLDRPVEFVVGAPIQMVDDVQWFRVADPAADRITWFAVDRPVYVALTLPQDSGPTPIQEISETLAKTLSAKPIDPAPVR